MLARGELVGAYFPLPAGWTVSRCGRESEQEREKVVIVVNVDADLTQGALRSKQRLAHAPGCGGKSRTSPRLFWASSFQTSSTSESLTVNAFCVLSALNGNLSARLRLIRGNSTFLETKLHWQRHVNRDGKSIASIKCG